MNGVATTTEVRPKTSSTSAGNAGPHAAAAIVWNRIIARSAHLIRMPESSVETGVGDNERGDDDVEDHADFDDERHALRHRHRCEEDPVLRREEAHHLG